MAMRAVTRPQTASDGPILQVVGRRRSKRLIKRSGSRRLAPFTILATIAIGAIIAAILLEQVVLAQSAFKLAQIRHELAEAERDREVLMLEAARLDSAARIERFARDSLGMIDPGPQDVRYIVANIPTRKLDDLAVRTGPGYRGAGSGPASALGAGAWP